MLVAWLAVPYALARLTATLAVYLLFSYPLWARIFRASLPARPRRAPAAAEA
jgi:hypothetical protein